MGEEMKPTNEQLLDEFCSYLRLRDVSEDTQRTYPRFIKALMGFYAGSLLDVTEEVLTSYLETLKNRGVQHASINRYFVGLNTFFKYLLHKKYIAVNPVLPIREYYLREFKSHDVRQRRKCLTVPEAAKLVNSIFSTRDKAIVVLLLKTGIRTKECAELDASFVNMATKTIHLKPTGKRSSETVYFDDETAYVLCKWIKMREIINKKWNPALFIDRFGNRLVKQSIYKMFLKYATAAGLHNPDSKRLSEKLTPHCTRYFFSNVLLEANMPRHYIKELRGDSARDALDLYTIIDKKKLQQSYEDCIPKLGII